VFSHSEVGGHCGCTRLLYSSAAVEEANERNTPSRFIASVQIITRESRKADTVRHVGYDPFIV